MPLIKRYIALIGLPLVGVTTAARLVAPLLNLQHVHVQHLLRDVDLEQVENDQPLLDYALLAMNSGHNGAVVQLVKGQLKQAVYFDGVLLDGIPNNLQEAILLEDYLMRQTEGIFQVMHLNILPQDELQLFERAKKRRMCARCGWTYGEHPEVRPFEDGLCDHCHVELGYDTESSSAIVRARIKWCRERMNPVLDYYRRRRRLIEWNISAANSPIQIAYGLAKYYAPLPTMQITSLRPWLPPLLPQLELPLNLGF